MHKADIPACSINVRFRTKHLRWLKCAGASGVSFQEVGNAVVTATLRPGKTEMRTAIRIHWQSGAIALTVTIFAFLVPGVVLCKLVSLVKHRIGDRNNEPCCWIRTLFGRPVDRKAHSPMRTRRSQNHMEPHQPGGDYQNISLKIMGRGGTGVLSQERHWQS
jgi:hypothetical protein